MYMYVIPTRVLVQTPTCRLLEKDVRFTTRITSSNVPSTTLSTSDPSLSTSDTSLRSHDQAGSKTSPGKTSLTKATPLETNALNTGVMQNGSPKIDPPVLVPTPDRTSRDSSHQTHVAAKESPPSSPSPSSSSPLAHLESPTEVLRKDLPSPYCAGNGGGLASDEDNEGSWEGQRPKVSVMFDVTSFVWN